MKENKGQKDKKADPEVEILLAEVLKKKGITKYAFARHYLNTLPNAVIPFFKPGHNPHIRTLAKWARALGVPVSDLFRVKPESK